MTTAQVVGTSVTVANSSFLTTPGSKPFTKTILTCRTGVIFYVFQASAKTDTKREASATHAGREERKK